MAVLEQGTAATLQLLRLRCNSDFATNSIARWRPNNASCLLMGVGSSSSSATLSFTDPKVCRSFLVGTCPHDLFTNTRQDLGPCPKTHNDGLKTAYQESPDKEKLGYEFDYMRDLQKHIDECNRRIDTAQRRLEKTPDEIRQTHTFLKQIVDLTNTINAHLEEITTMASLGSVGLAYDEFFKMRQAQLAKEKVERELRELSDNSGSSGHQKLQVCDVCGAYLSRLDNDRRLADHFYGKMHIGYAQMRKTYDALKEELKGKHPPPPTYESSDRDFGDDRYGRNYGRGGRSRGGNRRGRW